MSSSSSALIHKGVYSGNVVGQEPLKTEIQTSPYFENIVPSGFFKEMMEMNAVRAQERPEPNTLAAFIQDGLVFELSRALEDRIRRSQDLDDGPELVDWAVKCAVDHQRVFVGNEQQQELIREKYKKIVEMLLQEGAWNQEKCKQLNKGRFFKDYTPWLEEGKLNVLSVAKNIESHFLIDLFLKYGVSEILHVEDFQTLIVSGEEINTHSFFDSHDSCYKKVIPLALNKALEVSVGQRSGFNSHPIPSNLRRLAQITLQFKPHASFYGGSVDFRLAHDARRDLMRLFRETFDRDWYDEYFDYIRRKGVPLPEEDEYERYPIHFHPVRFSDYLEIMDQREEASKRLKRSQAFPRKWFQSIPKSQKDPPDPSRLSRVSLDLRDLPKRA